MLFCYCLLVCLSLMKLFQPEEASYHVFGTDVSRFLQQQLNNVLSSYKYYFVIVCWCAFHE